MKKSTLSILFCVWACCTFSQEEKAEIARPKQRHISDKGYWVMVTIPEKPGKATVYYYNNNHQLLKQQELNTSRFSVNRKRNCMQLKKTLEQSVIEFNRAQLAATERKKS